MKRILLLVFSVFTVVCTSCLPLIEPSVMESIDIPAVAGASHTQNTDTSQGVQNADLNMGGNSITNVNLVDGVDISGIGGASHTQNTDWTLRNAAGGLNLIHNGYIVSDMRTDRWLLSDRNTFFGVDVTGGVGVLSGTMNTAYGNETMYDISTGASNTAVGWRSQKGLTEGNFNTSAGDQTLVALTTGTGNTAVGASTLASVKTSGYNTGVGADVLWNATSGYNTGVGAFTGAAVVDGDYNTYLGYDAGNDNVSGDNNVAVGAQAGHTNTGSGNVFLGYKAGEDSGATSNTLYIDNSDDATPLIYGDFSTDMVTINEDLTVADDAEVVGTLNLSGDAIIKTDKTSARDLTITTGATKTIKLTNIAKLTLRPDIVEKDTKKVLGIPTQIMRGCNVGYSFPIFAANDEELYWRMRIPNRWDGVTDPQFGICVSLISGEDVGDKFKFSLEWQTTNKGNIMGTSTSVCYSEQTVLVGRNDAYDTYFIFFTLDASDVTNPITAGEMLQGRIRRVAASSSDVSGEIGVWDWAIMWPVDKVFGVWSVETND